MPATYAPDGFSNLLDSLSIEIHFTVLMPVLVGSGGHTESRGTHPSMVSLLFKLFGFLPSHNRSTAM